MTRTFDRFSQGRVCRVAALLLVAVLAVSACGPPRNESQDRLEGQLSWSEDYEVTQRDRSNMNGTGPNMLWLYGTGALDLALPTGFERTASVEGVAAVNEARQWRGPDPLGNGECLVTRGVIESEDAEALEFGGLNSRQVEEVQTGNAQLVLVFTECEESEPER